MFLAITYSSLSQSISEKLPHFNKIILGPYINLTLDKGKKEKIEVYADNLDLDKINFKIRHGTLMISLDDWFKNEIIVQSGTINKFKGKLVGENLLNAKNVSSQKIKCFSIGENEFICNSEKNLKVF
jgi:hypothetical protein